jgi:hypothetical protein
MPIQFITPSIISSVANTQVTGTITASQIAAVNANTITSGTIPLAQVPQLSAAKLPTGSVLQVVQTVKSDTFSTSNTSFVDITGLSATITPTSSSNKILVQVAIGSLSSTAGVISYLTMLRGSTYIAAGDGAAGVLNQQYAGSTGTGSGYYGNLGATAIYLDSPATTSATTYKIQLAAYGGQTSYINRSAYDSTPYNGRTISSITLMEIAA